MQFIMTVYGKTGDDGVDVLESISFSACESKSGAESYRYNINNLQLKDGRWAYARIVEEHEKIIPERPPSFDIINTLGDRAIQKVMCEVDSQELAKALKSVDAEVQDKFFRNMSRRAAGMLKEDMEYMGPVRISDVKEAQGKIALIVQRLLKAGEIAQSPKEELEEDKSAADYINRGHAYYEKGEYDEAIADYTQIIKLDPDDYEAYYNRSDAYYKKGEYDLAIADYANAKKLKERDHYDFDEDDDFDLGLDDIGSSHAHRGDPRYFRRSDECCENGDYDGAIAVYNQAIMLDPDNAAAYCLYRGRAYSKKGSYDEAIADFTKAMELNPKDDIAYRNRLFTYCLKGDYDKAIADCNHVIESDPDDNVVANVIRFFMYFKKGDYDLANAEFTKIFDMLEDKF